jgi:serine/threonine-protein kinase
LADRYRFERELGQGGMATVYLAHDAKHDRKVAIKVLRPELAAAIGAERFLKEIKTTANLQHPHILGLIDSGESDGLLWYAMPFVEGESLRDRLSRDKQLPIPDAVRVATEVAGALDYAHRRGVIHRDIKPENILLHDGSALVADFGIALAASTAGTRITETGMSVGTPQYMSPEQAMGEREITARTDVYALGCITYEMLVGEPPFTGPTAQTIIAKAMTEDPRPPRRVRHSVPGHVETAVLCALARLPADRFGTASEFAKALVTPTGETSQARPDAGGWRRRFGLPGVGAGLLLGLIVAGAWIAARPRLAVMPRFASALSLPPAAPLVTSRGNRALAISPDGTDIVYVSAPDSSGTALYVRTLNALDPVMIPRTRGVIDPQFSPDGHWLAFIDVNSWRLMKMHYPVTGSPPIAVAGKVGSFSWGDRDVILVTRTDEQGLWITDAEGGSLRLAAAVDTAGGITRYVRPRLLPGSTLAVFTAINDQSEDTELALVDLGKGRVRRLGIAGSDPQYLQPGALLFGRKDGSAAIVGFDPKGLRVVGTPVTVLDSMLVESGGRAEVAVSAGGTLAYVQGRKEEQLVRVDRHGAVTQILGTQPGRFGPIRFSPNCDWVAALAVVPGAQPFQVITMGVRTGARFTLATDGRAASPGWAADGRVVWSTRGGDSLVAPGLMAQSWDGTGRPSRIRTERAVDGGVMSPSGKLFVFMVPHRPGSDIYVAPLDSTIPSRPVVQNVSANNGPAASFDDQWLAYTSDRLLGQYNVYVTSLRDTSVHVRVSPNGGTEPAWSADGQTLFYRSSSELSFDFDMLDHPDVLLAAHLELGAHPRVLGIDTLFANPYSRYARVRYYDVCKDGSFLMAQSGRAQHKLVVVTGWLEVQRDRVAHAIRGH